MNSVMAEECFMNMKSIMERIKNGEKGRSITRDIEDLSNALMSLCDELEASQ